MLIWHGFYCPNNHLSLINEAQGENKESIKCSSCDFKGLANEGRLGERYEEHDYMGALKG